MIVMRGRLTPDPFFFLCPLVLSTNAKLVCPKPFTPSQVYLHKIKNISPIVLLNIYRQICLWINHELQKPGYLPRFSLSTFAISSLLPGQVDIGHWTIGQRWILQLKYRAAETICVIAMAYLVFNWCDFIKNLAFQKFCIRHHSILVPGTLGSRKV